MVEYIENLHFDEEDIAYLRSKDCFAEEFLDYLRNSFHSTGHLAVPEQIPFDYTVLLAGFIGGMVAVLNFFLMGLTVQKIVPWRTINRLQRR